MRVFEGDDRIEDRKGDAVIAKVQQNVQVHQQADDGDQPGQVARWNALEEEEVVEGELDQEGKLVRDQGDSDQKEGEKEEEGLNEQYATASTAPIFRVDLLDRLKVVIKDGKCVESAEKVGLNCVHLFVQLIKCVCVCVSSFEMSMVKSELHFLQLP